MMEMREMQRPRSTWGVFFCGMWFTGAVAIAAGALITLYGMRIVDRRISTAIGLAENAVGNLPAFLDSLPPVLGEVIHDRRAPEYRGNVEAKVEFTSSEATGVRPVVTITNNGDEVISMLTVRVAALGREKLPLAEWTEVAATPLAFDDDWRGPLLPRETRYIVLSSRKALRDAGDVTGVMEISELRVWEPKATLQKTAYVTP